MTYQCLSGLTLISNKISLKRKQKTDDSPNLHELMGQVFCVEFDDWRDFDLSMKIVE